MIDTTAILEAMADSEPLKDEDKELIAALLVEHETVQRSRATMTSSEELAHAWDEGHRARGTEQNPYRELVPPASETGVSRCVWGSSLPARGAWCPLPAGHPGPHIQGSD